ncbi:MAG: DNA polymerase III subunit beta [Bacteroidetes bacterium]|nr:DNA polymerase III subunit beta [Bacteroidota bacterium]
MRFIINSTALLKGLQSISGVLSSNNTLPILDDFLFEVGETSLKVTSSDLETTMTVELELTKSEETGAIAVPAKILLETLKTFSDIPIIFHIDEDTQLIEISAGDGKYKLTGHKGEEYPKSPQLEDTTFISLESAVLANAISKTIFATGNDDLRPVMSGVFCELEPDSITFVATDAHKLVRYRRTDVQAEASASFVLPKKPLNMLKNLLSNDASAVRIEYNQTNALFVFRNFQLICRLIDGKYPNYDAVIPSSNPNKLFIERIPFLNSIKRVAIFANQSTHQIRLKLSGQELILSAEDIDYSNEAKERLNCNYEGDDIEIGFNSKFLLEMLNNLDSDEIRVEMSAPNRAGIILPVNTDSKDEDILMLIMPVMLNS